MWKALFKPSTLFLSLVLLLASCGKEQELQPTTPSDHRAPILALEEDFFPCEEACTPPSSVFVTNLTSCSATINWVFPREDCGSFSLLLRDQHSDAVITYNAIGDHLILAGLEPCTEYTLDISHIAAFCSSVPVTISFQTECESCEVPCERPCQSVDFLQLLQVKRYEATVQFGHETPLCGDFMVYLKNNTTNEGVQYFHASSSLQLQNLEPCTSYTVLVSHVANDQACPPVELTFETECGYCEAEGDDNESAYFDFIGFGLNGLYQIGALGYVNITNPPLELPLDFVFNVGFCYQFIPNGTLQPTHVKMWIDFDGDTDFDNDELVVDFATYNINLCEYNYSPLISPQDPACNLQARMMISLNNTIVSPCDDIAEGQVVDFLVDIGECN
ncbi:MAG: fibronectin type III domain-containing protein [Bacteroidota bacterium]